MAAEGHGARSFCDRIWGAQQLLFYKVYCQHATLRLERHPIPPLRTPYLWGLGVLGQISS